MEGNLISEVDELSKVNSQQFNTLNASYKLIDKLTNLIKGTKPEIDNQSNKLRKAAQKNEPVEKVSKIIDSLLDLVVNAEKDQMTAIREVRAAMLSAGETLQKSKGLEDNLRRQLRMVVNRLKTGVSTYSEAQPLLVSLLEILT